MVERSIRTVKERSRCIIHDVPFKYWPRALVSQMVQAVIFWLNALPPRDGVHKTLSPRSLLIGTSLDYAKQCNLPFGTYVHTHEKSDNTMAPRTVAALALRPHPTGNGNFLFLSLRSGRVLNRGSRSYTELPMPSTVIDQINALGEAAGAAPGVYFADTSDDIPFHPDDIDNPPTDHDLDPDIGPVDPTEPADLVSDWQTIGSPNAGVIPRTRDPATQSDPATQIAGPTNTRYNNRYDALSDIEADDETTDDQEANDDMDTDDDTEDNDMEDTDSNMEYSNNQHEETNYDETNDDDTEYTTPDDNIPVDTEDTPYNKNRSADTPYDENRSVNTPDDEDRSADTPLEQDVTDDTIDDNPDTFVDTDNPDAVPDDEPAADFADNEFVTNVNDPTLAPKLRAELTKLASHNIGDHPAGTISTVGNPMTHTGMTTRSGTILATHGSSTYCPDNPKSVSPNDIPLPIDPQAWVDEYGAAFGFTFAQYHMNKGLKLFGDRGIQAIKKEMMQLDQMDTIAPVQPKDLSAEERDRVLEYLMFLKEKRNGIIKGRGCADGRKQRQWTDKYDSSSPTAFLESLFHTASIAAKERRKVLTLDIPGAFLQANQDPNEIIHVRLQGEMATLLCKINPDKYETYVVMERGTPVIYAKLKRCLYGTLRAAIQFWNLLSDLLKSWGYIPNPYDPCVMNKMVNGKQCTVLWHVDDLMVSHVEQAVLDDLVTKLNDRFGSHLPVVAQHGDVHDYLGMTLDFSDTGKVKIIMDDFVQKLLSELPTDDYWQGIAPDPAATSLFNVRNTSPKLNQRDADLFHSTTAKLLFLGMRARPDIMTAVSFLTTRVTSPDTDDRNKLRRVIQYLRGTRDLHLTLEPDDLHIYKWWIDASFAVHPNMRSHTGATASCGRGSFLSISSKQKINTRSSTTAELVGVDDCMGKILWTINFLQAQGYTTRHIIGQDNQSAILLEKNGRLSSSKRTRHMNFRYFFITDCISKGQVEIEYVPTKEMLGDFFTKPLHGYLFKKLRAHILNLPLPEPPLSMVKPAQSLHDSFASQECVGQADRRTTDSHKLNNSHSVE